MENLLKQYQKKVLESKARRAIYHQINRTRENKNAQLAAYYKIINMDELLAKKGVN